MNPLETIQQGGRRSPSAVGNDAAAAPALGDRRPPKSLCLFFILASFFLVATRLTAQSARWEPASGSLPVGQSTALRLVFENCEPNDDPAPPKVEGLTLQLYGTASNTSIVNGTVTVSKVFTFAAHLTKNERVEIPGFTLETNKGPVRVPPARFEPTAATVGRSGTPLSDAATARLTPTPATVWAGEVFDLQASISAARSFYPQFTRGFDWTAEPLLVESWSEPQQVDFNSGTEPHAGVLYRTRGLARSPGRFNLNAATHLVNLSVGMSGFGFFQERRYDQYSITSNTPTVEVKALPPAPASFSGAVGQLQLTSKVVPEKAGIGEPITWTLELSGTGNWPDIAGLPAREVSSDFQVVQPKAKRTPAEGKIFDVTLTEDVVLVPTKAGTYTLGPVNFTYFDPKSGTYKTLTTPRTTVSVTAPASAPITLNLGTQPAATPPAEPAATREPVRPPSIPEPPAAIPRDPLPGSDVAPAPLRMSTIVLGSLSSVLCLLLFWFWLALREAQKTDPLLPRREARVRLAATLQKLRHTTGAERTALLLAWQRDAATLWQLAHAAPPATALGVAEWSELWTESDRALYGASPELPSDWIARAEAALAAKRLPAFRPLRLFLPRNLFPFAAALALVWFAQPSILRAAEAVIAAYNRGDFPAAEKSWRETLAQQPTDWIARHNLSLALAQQDRAGEAMGHASAAFVQHPRDPAVRWHFAHAAQRASIAPPDLAPFLDPDPTQSLAQAASAPTWQRLILAAAWLGALALGAILYNSYRRKSVLVYCAAAGVFFGSLALTATATVGVLTYGVAAKENAVVVWRAGILRSIPTEADTTQKTTPLAAGSIALVDQTFLDDRWLRLAFENGQTGWVRREEVVSLWK